MNKMIHLTLFLGIVSAIAGGALSYVNGITAPIIEENNAKLEKQTLLTMFEGSTEADFEALDVSGIESSTLNNAYAYQDMIIFNMSVSGYKDGTTFLVAINTKDHTIANYYGISNGDTKGLGSQVLDEPFRKSLIDKDASGQLDTISGATVSSGPVVEAIHEADTYVDQLKK